jgi:phosphoadenosine phosphosulfate reductase
MALLEAFARPFDPVASAATHAGMLSQQASRWTTHELLDQVINREFAGRVALVSSFGAESVVLLHLVASVAPGTPVVFIDTGKLFGSTLRYRDELVSRLGLKDVRVARPDPAQLAERENDSPLWLRDPDPCCGIRKVAPLSRALSGFDAWISGRKRYQGGSRTRLPLFDADGHRVKVNPLADWSKAEIAAYVEEHNLPEHPLVADGYRSIGCMPCTDRVTEGDDDRSGRWRGLGKTECGIHLGLAWSHAGASRL